MVSNAKQSKEIQDKSFFISDMVFQDKISFYLVNCIEKNLAPLYITNKKKGNSIKEKNIEFRQNEKNYITILARLDYILHFLKEHGDKFNNLIVLQSRLYSLSRVFPNIQNLFYERFINSKLIPGIEEDELDDDPDITDGDIYLHDIAKRLYYLGLGSLDISYSLYNYYSDYYSDSEG